MIEGRDGGREGRKFYLGDEPIPFSSAQFLRIPLLRIGGGVGCVGA